jgi:hypothetical protein
MSFRRLHVCTLTAVCVGLIGLAASGRAQDAKKDDIKKDDTKKDEKGLTPVPATGAPAGPG